MANHQTELVTPAPCGSFSSKERAVELKPLKSLAQLIAEQGTRSLSFDEMLGDFWPVDEPVDEFLSTWRRWRSEAEEQEMTQ